MTTTRAGLALCMLLLAAPCARAGWFDDPLTKKFLQPPAWRDAALSPDGRHLATLRVDGDWHATMTVADLEKNVEWEVSPVHRMSYDYGQAVQMPDYRPVAVHWIDDELLALDCAEDLAYAVNVKGAYVSELGERYLGTYRPDGATAFTTIIWGALSGPAPGVRTHMPTAGAPMPAFDPTGSGEVPLRWLTDATGALRTVTTLRVSSSAPAPVLVTRARRAEGDAWTVVDERKLDDDPFMPVATAKDPGRILVQARNGGDRLAIWNYDLQQHRFLDVAAASPDSDIVRVANRGAVDGLESVTTDGLKEQTLWFDDRMKGLQVAIDQVLPVRANLLQPSRSAQVLVLSSSDVDPGRLYLLDARTMKMQFLGAREPGIAAERMQAMQTLHYASFDGLQVPAYLTLPGKPGKPVPTIVLIHGGPQARDRWAFNSEVQILAAHGYAVFQPQFRGSAGFGRKFEQAGYGQWGQAMQDDITAGVHYLVDQGIADPKRICIVGASYGGYAALWGLARTPELYKCGVSIAGVSDLELMLNDDSDVAKSNLFREMQRSRVGDPDLMQATWDSVSPLRHADLIQAPLLLVHGERDQRVPIVHGEKMRDAMKARHKDVTWLTFPHEGHGIVYADDLTDMYEAMFSLFKRTIGKGEPPLPIAASGDAAAANGSSKKTGAAD